MVGAVDAIFPSDIKKRVKDGLPETLPEWIRYNGLTPMKIKLNGDDLAWGIDRVLNVDRAATKRRSSAGFPSGFIRSISMRNARMSNTSSISYAG